MNPDQLQQPTLSPMVQPILTEGINLAVVGSRTFDDYPKLKKEIDNICKQHGSIAKIISGGANGADKLGELYAREHNIPTQIFIPNWNLHGKAAGIIRNRDIIFNSNMVIAFWDGKSKGTKNSIDLAKSYNLEVHTIYF